VKKTVLSEEEFTTQFNSWVAEKYADKQGIGENTTIPFDISNCVNSIRNRVLTAFFKVYTPELYKAFVISGEDFEGLKRATSSFLEELFEKASDIDIDALRCNDKAKHFIHAKPYAANEAKNNFGTLRVVGDIALSLHLLVLNDQKELFGAGLASPLPVSMSENIEVVLSEALENSSTLFPARLFSDNFLVCASKNELLKNDRYDIWAPDLRFIKGRLFYVLTNNIMQHGASALFYPGVLKRLRKLLGEDYFIVPKNIHQMHIYPASRTTSGKVREAAQRASKKSDLAFLSRTAYKYVSRLDELVKA
jgi:hypothetical protein